MTSRTRVIPRTLRAFGKCTDGVASSKGRQNLDSVRLTVYEEQYFTHVLSCSNLFTPVYNCSHLFTPVHTSVTTLFVQWQFLVYNTVGMWARRAMSFFALSNALILRSYVLSC